MILGYNTNGLAHHRLLDALELCAKIGYRGLAVTLDIAHLDPYSDWKPQAKALRERADDLGMALSVETGARFVLEAGSKHEPNLMDVDSERVQRRVDFYWRCIEVAVALGSPLISLWSGKAANDFAGEIHGAYEHLANGLYPVLKRAQEEGVLVCFEPEPGMFLETPEQYTMLKRLGGSRLANMRMTLDVGHCLVTGGQKPQAAILEYAPEIEHVHLDDIRNGVHEHLMFGAGDIDLNAVMSALQHIEYSGMAAVELSRDSHRGADAATQAYQFLNLAL